MASIIEVLKLYIIILIAIKPCHHLDLYTSVNTKL